MKYYSTHDLFKFSWDQVTTGFWSRYPNPHSNHVISEDTVLRKVVNGCLVSHRLITKVNSIPKWGALIVPGGSKKVCILEESIIDPKAKTLTTYTTNLGMKRVMSVDEKCVYTPSQDNKSWTECHRQAWISSSVYGFSSAIQSFGIEKFKKSIPKTVKGYEYILHKLYLPDVIPEQSKLRLNTEKLKESKEKIKESAQKAKESAKELAKKSKTASVVA